MPKITTTGELTSYAVKVFRRAGFHCWRENTTGVWDAKAECYRKPRGQDQLLGKSDVIGFHLVTGRPLACEVKVGADRLRPEQEDYLLKVRSAGGLAVVVKHGDDLTPYLEGDHGH